MKYCTCGNSSWLRKTTATGLGPLLLLQVSIAVLCVPKTLSAGTENRREMAWKELTLLKDEPNVTISLYEGGAVRGDVVTVQQHGIHLHRITMATDRQRYPRDSYALIARSDVKEIRVETLRGSLRWSGALGFGLLGCWMGAGFALGDLPAIRNSAAGATVWFGSIVGATFLGYKLGERKDRETTTITVLD